MSVYENCNLCHRLCGADRENGRLGFCKSTSKLEISRAALHFWEEPVISGTGGSGTVFFSGCSLGCVFCQNREISSAERFCSDKCREVTEGELAKIMFSLENAGAHNINLVTPTHFVPSIISAVSEARKIGLSVPIVYNSGSYETVETVKSLSGTVDVYLLDYKFHREITAERLANAKNYPQVARAVIAEAVSQRGLPILEDGIIKSGVIVRILLLPGHLAEAKLSLKYLCETYGDSIYVSLMNQYTPMPNMKAPLDRKVSISEYSELVDYALKKGVKSAFIQESGTASEAFIPPFDLTGTVV